MILKHIAFINMKSFFGALLFLFSLSSYAYAQNNLKVVVFGDSLTSGYQLQANESYANKLYYKLKEVGYTNVEVVNMSVPGQTTNSGVGAVREVLAKRPDIVIVQLGMNDALRGVSTDLIYKNLIDIIGELQRHRVYVILMGAKAPESMGHTYVRHLDAVFERLVGFYRVPFYPNVMEGIGNNPSLTLADGFRPNGKGIHFMVESTYLLVDAALRWKWKDLAADSGYVSADGEALPLAMPPTAEPPAQPPIR